MAVFSVVFITALLTLPHWVFMSAINECDTDPDNQRSEYFHITEGFSLFHHILSTHYTESSLVCGSLCLRNKQCRSFNFGKRATSNGKFVCELSSSHACQSPMDLKERSNFQFFTFLRGGRFASCDQGDVTYNGCCKSYPCVNGGTCHEICDPASIRYNCYCSCPVPFVGKHCEIQLRRSCQDYKAAGFNKTGLYNVTDNMDQTFQVFCDFDSEPGFAWNLIESFALANKTHFQNPDLVFYSYTDSSAVSGDSPNWQAYLIKPAYLLWLRDQSTHWRATCRYNTDGTVYKDYVRASLEDFDITAVPTTPVGCRKYEFINIRGNECVDCTVTTVYIKGTYPLVIESTYPGGCTFDGHKSGDARTSEDNFGWYNVVNPKFRCTSSSESTTQIWIGGK